MHACHLVHAPVVPHESEQLCADDVQPKGYLLESEELEGTDLDHLGQQKADMYMCELGVAGDELIERVEGFNRDRGAELVRQLFHSEQ